jgi:hypothetical protein
MSEFIYTHEWAKIVFIGFMFVLAGIGIFVRTRFIMGPQYKKTDDDGLLTSVGIGAAKVFLGIGLSTIAVGLVMAIVG